MTFSISTFYAAILQCLDICMWSTPPSGHADLGVAFATGITRTVSVHGSAKENGMMRDLTRSMRYPTPSGHLNGSIQPFSFYANADMTYSTGDMF